MRAAGTSRRGVRWGNDQPERGELSEAREAACEQASVDGARDPRAGRDRGDNRHAGDLAHVPLGQAAAVLSDEDDPVE